MKRFSGLVIIWALALAGPVAYGAGYDPAAPWPAMRHDYENTGRADNVRPSQAVDLSGEKIWSFPTGRPIFSTPVVGADGTVYIGSADFVFYAINPDGSLKWKLRTGKLIDSAAALSADGRVYVPGGDGYLYALDQQTGEEYWRFEAHNARSGKVQMVNWFEGNVALSPTGTILAGNDDFRLYELAADGREIFEFATGGIVWSAIPTDREGRHFLCSLDMYCYGVDGRGQKLWDTGFWGIFSASPAIGPSGSVYVAGFDGNVYALDPATGKKLWTFKTGDHVYASVAIAKDGTLYIGSTDGTMYALTDLGESVSVKWAFDTLDPIRASAAVDGDGNIYFGNSDGRLFVLNPDGTRRWSLDLTESDKNDINASPALSAKSVVLAMQDGRILSVPFDYCLRPDQRDNARCNVNPGEGLPDDGEFLYWTTPGGSPLPLNETVENVLPGSVITLRLVARRGGDTLLAGIEKDTLRVTVEPEFARHVAISIDHRFIDIVPDEVLEPGREYRVSVRGQYREQGLKLLGHIWLTGGKRLGEFADEVTFRVAKSAGAAFVPGEPVVLTHMSFYQPTIFPSIAQIGMDDMNFIIIPVEERSPGRWIAWGVVAAPGADGQYHPEPGNRVTFPATIEYHGDIVKIYSRDLEFDHAGDRLGMSYFMGSGVLEQPGRETLISRNTLYSEGKNLSMAGSFYDLPTFDTPLAGTMHISAITLPPETGISVTALRRNGRTVVAEYNNQAGITAADNNLCVMLIDNKTREPLVFDYAAATSQITGSGGEALRTEVKLPFKYIGHSDFFAVVLVNGVEVARGEAGR